MDSEMLQFRNEYLIEFNEIMRLNFFYHNGRQKLYRAAVGKERLLTVL